MERKSRILWMVLVISIEYKALLIEKHVNH